MKKRLITLTLVLLLVASMAAPAMAADGDPITASDGRSTTLLSYNVTSSFTVTIPASVTVGGEAVEVKVAAAPVIEYGKKISVKITDAVNKSGEDNFRLSDGHGNFIVYAITNGETPVEFATEFLSQLAAAAGEASASLTFAATGTPTHAGAYSDTITFTASIVNAAK